MNTRRSFHGYSPEAPRPHRAAALRAERQARNKDGREIPRRRLQLSSSQQQYFNTG